MQVRCAWLTVIPVSGMVLAGPSSGISSADGVVYQLQTCQDPLLGIPAYSILVPEWWVPSGQVIWQPGESLMNVAAFPFDGYDPHSLDAIAIWPHSLCAWF